MSDQQRNDNPVTYYTGMGLAVGMAVGLVFGAAIGDTSIGLALGLTFGLVIGAAIGKSKKQQRETDSPRGGTQTGDRSGGPQD